MVLRWIGMVGPVVLAIVLWVGQAMAFAGLVGVHGSAAVGMR